MKYLAIFLAGGLSVAAFVVFAQKHSTSPSAPPPPPSASAPAPVKGLLAVTQMPDVVRVEVGETRYFEVVVKNLSTHPFTISKVVTGCACREATADPETVPANGTSVLRYTYNASKSNSGEILVPVVVQTADSRNLTADASVRIRHSERVKISPSPLYLSEIPLGQESRSTVTVRWPADLGDVVPQVTSEMPGLTVGPVEGERGEKSFTLTLEPQSVSRSSSGIVQVTLPGFDERDAVFRVGVHAQVVSAVSVDPSRGFFGLISGDSDKTITLRIKSAVPGTPLTLDSVTGPEWLTLRHEAASTSSDITITLSARIKDKSKFAQSFPIRISGKAGEHEFCVDLPCVAVEL